MKQTIILSLAGAILCLAACNNDPKEDVTNGVNKTGSVETAVTVQHADSTHDVLTTTHKVWTNNSVWKTIVYNDTIPALGTEHTTGENANGDTAQVSIKKDYEIFITVK